MKNEIEGVIIKPLKKIPDERGCIFHMLRCDDPVFEKFGEIYFSSVHPGIVKGWHMHKQMTLIYAVIYGKIRLVLFDSRENSKTRGNVMEILAGQDNYCLIKIPPGIWNGFQGMGDEDAIVANCATIPHDPTEIIRIDPFSEKIPFNWRTKE